MTEREAYEQGQEDGRREQRARNASEGPVRAGDEDAIFSEPQGDLSLRLGKRQVDIARRWEAASILNDVMVGVWFVAGSIFNFFTDLELIGLVLYLLGSLQLLLRAFIRLGRRVYVRRVNVRSRPRMYRPDVDAPDVSGDGDTTADAPGETDNGDANPRVG